MPSELVSGALAEVDRQLSGLADPSSLGNNSEFLKKASYYLISDKLVQNSNVNYERLVRSLSPETLRDFVRATIQEIEATDGRVTAITFKNGVTHRFTYAPAKGMDSK